MAKRKRSYGSIPSQHRSRAGGALYVFRKAASRIGAEMAKKSPDCGIVLEYFRTAATQAGRYTAERSVEGLSRAGGGVMRKLNGLESRVYKRCILKGGGY